VIAAVMMVRGRDGRLMMMNVVAAVVAAVAVVAVVMMAAVMVMSIHRGTDRPNQNLLIEIKQINEWTVEFQIWRLHT
jgi:hypothetical protein